MCLLLILHCRRVFLGLLVATVFLSTRLGALGTGLLGALVGTLGGLLRALLGARGAGLRGAVCGTGLLGVLLGAVARRAPSTGLAGILLGALGSGFLRLPLLGRMCWRRGFLGRRFGGLLGWRCGGILGLCGRRGTFLFGSWGGLCFRCLGACFFGKFRSSRHRVGRACCCGMVLHFVSCLLGFLLLLLLVFWGVGLLLGGWIGWAQVDQLLVRWRGGLLQLSTETPLWGLRFVMGVAGIGRLGTEPLWWCLHHGLLGVGSEGLGFGFLEVRLPCRILELRPRVLGILDLAVIGPDKPKPRELYWL